MKRRISTIRKHGSLVTAESIVFKNTQDSNRLRRVVVGDRIRLTLYASTAAANHRLFIASYCLISGVGTVGRNLEEEKPHSELPR